MAGCAQVGAHDLDAIDDLDIVGAEVGLMMDEVALDAACACVESGHMDPVQRKSPYVDTMGDKP